MIGDFEIRAGDCVTGLSALAEPARLIFADPPYNVGVDYGKGAKADRLTADAYSSWTAEWVGACVRSLTPDGSLWVLISDECAIEVGAELKRAGLTIRDWVKWHESFGVNCTRKFNRCTRHLFHAVIDPGRFVFDASAVKRPSKRQTVYGDRRANPDGKVLDDLWDDIPRLAGTHAERIPGFPTQLPTALTARVIGCASEKGDLVVDPFAGSGTTGVSALRLGRRFIGFEKNGVFARVARHRLNKLAQRSEATA